MKANYTICLDKEKVDEIKIWLGKRGLTFSGYINSMIEQQIAAVNLLGEDADVNKLTMSKFSKMVGKMFKELKKND